MYAMKMHDDCLSKYVVDVKKIPHKYMFTGLVILD